MTAVTGHVDEAARRVWQAMRSVVLEQGDRRQEAYRATGLSFGRLKALRMVAGAPVTQRELAERLATDPPYVTVMVDDLVRRGLVERQVHPTDRRRRLVVATDSGAEVARSAGAILEEPPAAVVALSALDLAALDRILGRILARPPTPD